jgi:glycosyltransferase involved in cell wall biosynthesis
VRLLAVAPYPPTPPFSGGRRRIIEQLKALSRHNTVDLCCLTFDDDEDERLTRLGLPNVTAYNVRHQWRDGQPRLGLPLPANKFWNSDLARRVRDLADSNSYDWVLAEHCYAAPYVRDLPMRKMLTEHNIEYRLFQQIAQADDDLSLPLTLCGTAGDLFRDAAQQLSGLRQFEQSAWTQVDLCVSVSEEERQVMTDVTAHLRVHVAPNCPDACTPRVFPDGRPRVAFIGALNYFPNVDAVVYLIHAVLPIIRRTIPEVEIVVAGRDPEPEMVEFCETNGVRVVANPIRIDGLFTARTVMACPLRFGAGTRIKALDAMARGIPVVGTSLAMEGLGAVAGRDFLVGDEPEVFSEHLVHLLSSPSLRSSISMAASRYLRMLDLNWPNVFAGLEQRLAGFHDSTKTA